LMSYKTIYRPHIVSMALRLTARGGSKLVFFINSEYLELSFTLFAIYNNFYYDFSFKLKFFGSLRVL
jgi:hypothetical protein